MTSIMKRIALGAMVASFAICQSVCAQDDLDALLKDLDEEVAKPAPKTEAKAEEKVEAEEPKAEEKVEEKAEEPKAEAEEPKAEAEEKAEEPKAVDAESSPRQEKDVATSEKRGEGTASTPEEPKAEEPKAEEKSEEKGEAEEPKAVDAESSPRQEKDVATSEKRGEGTASTPEEPKVETEKPAAAAKAGQKTASSKDVDEVLNLLDDLAAESAEKEKAEEVATEKVEEPKTEEPKVEEPKAEEKAEEPKAEEPKAEAEEKAEEPKAEEPKAEEKADEPKTEEPKASEPSKPSEPSEPSKLSKPARPDAELIENLRSTEKLRRTALDAQAMREIKNARTCMENAEYGDAVRHYGLAMKLLNDRASSKDLRRECDQGVAEGLYRAALQEDDLGRRERAQKLMEKALDMRHPKARRILERWHAEENRVDERVDVEELKHRQNESDYKLSREQIRKHLRRSRQYLAVRDMEHALEECEIVLVNDPYNYDAIRIRRAIQKKRKVTLEQEREAAREGMIADVDEKWRPVYAVNAARLNETTAETVKKQTGEDPERTMEQDIERRMKEMRLPTVSFKPPATIIDAVDFFRGASKDYDRPDIPIEKRGFNFVLKTPQGALKQQAPQEEESSDDFASNDNGENASAPSNGLPPIPTITASDITFYEALKLVCDSVDYKFIVRGPVVMVMQKDMSTAELLSRKYDVLDAFLERMTAASSDVKEMKSAGFGGGNSKKEEGDGENQEKDWKEFFSQMGVKWPEGSSIMYIKTLGKLYVRNTRENLAEFEKVLQEMGSQPKLIEIETRFVEVSQEDLNSLGFEWILNSDYSLNVGDKLGKALGIGTSHFAGSETTSQTLSGYTVTTKTEGGTTTQTLTPNYTTTTTKTPTQGASLVEGAGAMGGDYRTIGVNAFGGSSQQQNGNRYLSTVGNHISGATKSTNDQFMRVNAFLGEADLSMILHMLSQRSDTDLLSAPKVVTKSGENAVIKVVTEYIYPQDYDVQLQSSSSGSSGGSSGGSQSAILAVVEPQNFTMREVGVILDVTPTYSEANGGTIDLELKPSVVELAEWHNYGMQIPFTGNTSSGTMADIGNIFSGMANGLKAIGDTALEAADVQAMKKMLVGSAMSAAENVSTSGSQSMTWYDAPMKQPFFHARSIDSKVSITPGSTVVMGGLITEERKAMDDKIPFLGDLPYVGRLFRSHSEQTKKRNLLIFVTGRLITPAGRELAINEETAETDEVKAAPKAE